ncbi:MAG: hypothetical protein HOQ18_09930 [Dermatophilaceae bacterium]|nr:hypothetical protein [Dermatophilaceae bacterium]
MTPTDASREGGAPGSVAEEAALLVDLLSQRGWGAASRMPSSTSSGNGHSAGAAHEHSAADPGDPPQGTAGSDGSDASGGGHSSRSECTCGGTTPAACRVCPVCQLIAFVQQVNPDTIDRVADFVGFAATALRDLATAQRERRGDASTDTDIDSDTDTDDNETDTMRPGGHS